MDSDGDLLTVEKWVLERTAHVASHMIVYH